MRLYQRILLVVILTMGMIAAGVAWERFDVSPLVEQAQRKPDPPDSIVDDLPAECLEELSTMGPPSTAMAPRPERPKVGAKTVLGELSPTADDNVLRRGSGSNQTAMHIQVADSAPSPSAVERDAAARPIQRAQSAEWVEPVA